MAAPAHRLNLKKHRAPHERLTKSADRSGVGRAKQEWAKAQDRFTLTPTDLLIEVQGAAASLQVPASPRSDIIHIASESPIHIAGIRTVPVERDRGAR